MRTRKGIFVKLTVINFAHGDPNSNCFGTNNNPSINRDTFLDIIFENYVFNQNFTIKVVLTECYGYKFYQSRKDSIKTREWAKNIHSLTTIHNPITLLFRGKDEKNSHNINLLFYKANENLELLKVLLDFHNFSHSSIALRDKYNNMVLHQITDPSTPTTPTTTTTATTIHKIILVLVLVLVLVLLSVSELS